jgi:phenylpropionate dioxygenase-like ring-hydroxylating dioxygenase large terminal subunit
VSHQQLVEAAKRIIAHTRAGTVPLADDVVRVPARNYLDPHRWQAEMDGIFRRVPLLLGFSSELREPHSYSSVDVLGVPVLLVRGGDGVLRSFVNTCSHRGAVVVPPGTGTARRFTCPYHAWSYDDSGGLVGVLDRAEFGDLDMSCHGLTPLPVAERAGLVLGGIVPGRALDIDVFLCGYDEMLQHLGLDHCTVVGRQTVAGPNWKLCYDGYLDFYHLPVLHRQTFGPDFPNRIIGDAWGPHQRNTSPDARLLKLEALPEAEWPVRKIDGGIWTLFPHVSIAPFMAGGRIYMVSQLLPGATPDTSVTVQHFLVEGELDDSRRAQVQQQMDFLLHVVRDEDYATCEGIQRGLRTGTKQHVLFGRNEEPCQRFHAWVDALVAADDAELVRLYEQAGAWPAVTP